MEFDSANFNRAEGSQPQGAAQFPKPNKRVTRGVVPLVGGIALIAFTSIFLIVGVVFSALNSESKEKYTGEIQAQASLVSEHSEQREDCNKSSSGRKTCSMRTYYVCALEYKFVVGDDSVKVTQDSSESSTTACAQSYPNDSVAVPVYYNEANPSDFTDFNPNGALATIMGILPLAVGGAGVGGGLLLVAMGIFGLVKYREREAEETA